LWYVASSKKQAEEKTQRPITNSVYFIHLGRGSLEPILTKFGNSLYFTDVINRSQVGVDWFGSFGSGEVQNLPCPIGTITGPYHCSAAALASDLLLACA